MQIKIIETNVLAKIRNLKKLEDKKPLLNTIGNHVQNIVSESFQEGKQMLYFLKT